MAIDPGGYQPKSSRVAWQRYSAAPKQKSAGTSSCPRAPLQKRPKSFVQAHSETGMRTYYYYYYYYTTGTFDFCLTDQIFRSLHSIIPCCTISCWHCPRNGVLVVGSQSSGTKRSNDGVKGYKSVVFRPTSPPSTVPSTHTVKYPPSQQTGTGSLRFSSDALPSDPTANGINCCCLLLWVVR